jgi:hypothetical protein
VRQAQRAGRLLDAEPAEVAQLDQPRLGFVDRGQLVERRVQVEQLGLGRSRRGQPLHQRHPQAPAPLGRGAGARMIHEDAPHEARGDAEELVTVLPAGVLLAQPQVGLVDQVGGPQAMSRALVAQVAGGAAPQLRVDDRDQAITRRFITAAPRLEQPRDLAGRRRPMREWARHAPECTRFPVHG